MVKNKLKRSIKPNSEKFMQLPAQCTLQRKDTFFGSISIWVTGLVEPAMQEIEHLLMTICTLHFTRSSGYAQRLAVAGDDLQLGVFGRLKIATKIQRHKMLNGLVD